MEKENSNFLNCHLNWSAAEPHLTYALPDQLQQQQQCFLPQYDSIGRLEGFGDPMSVALQPQQWSSAGCFGPRSLNSPPKLNLAMVGHQKQALAAGEPSGLVERAAGMPRLGVGVPNYGAKFPLLETGRLPGTRQATGADNEMAVMPRSSAGDDGESRCVRGESSASEHTASETNSRRKRTFKAGEEGSSEVNAKRSRAAEATGGSGKDEVKPKVEVGGEEQKPAKASEAPKQDYIHVRARRGQATDAHSLAERVRREKISERMKFLQNLVPGCNKVTGKAVMLDEIINYVQSLQRQVEFLSMKLATVNPRLDINVDNLLQKDMHQRCGSLSHPVYTMGTMASTFPMAHQPPQGAHLQGIATSGMESHSPANPLNLMLSKRPLGVQPPMLDAFTDAGSQVGVVWEDDLHKVVQMGSGQNQDDMKIKL